MHSAFYFGEIKIKHLHIKFIIEDLQQKLHMMHFTVNCDTHIFVLRKMLLCKHLCLHNYHLAVCSSHSACMSFAVSAPLHPLFRCHICSHICISPLVCFPSVSQELILIIPYFAGVNAHSSTHHPCGYLVASCASRFRLSPTCLSFRAPASVSQSVLFPPSQQPAPVSHSSGLTL